MTKNTNADRVPRVYIDGNGTIWVAWASQLSGNFDIWVTHSNITLTAPAIGSNLTGTFNISFTSISGDHLNDTYELAYSRDNVTWTVFASGIAPDDIYTSKNYSWNTSNLSDGNYTLRARRVNTKLTQTNLSGNITLDNAPASATVLAATVAETVLNWTWTNPTDADFSHVEVWIDGLFAGNRSNATFENASLACGTSRTISLRTTDNKNHLNSTWVNLTSTTTACQAPLPAPVAGTSSGGGGCCAPAPAPARAGEPVIVVLPPGAPVEKIEVVTDEPVAVKVSVKPMAGPPPGAPPPPGPVARFMEISLTGPSGEPVKAKSVAMEFSVERTWMNQNGVPQERVALARLEGERWAPYPAKVVGESPAEVKFRAEVPGTSVFAVTAGPPPTPEPSPTPHVSTSPSAGATSAPSLPSPTIGQDAVRAPSIPTPRQPGFEVALALVGLAVACLGYRRHR